jgi:hypothetical protein
MQKHAVWRISHKLDHGGAARTKQQVLLSLIKFLLHNEAPSQKLFQLSHFCLHCTKTKGGPAKQKEKTKKKKKKRNASIRRNGAHKTSLFTHPTFKIAKQRHNVSI